jgi:hypothetical protein
MAFLVVIEMVVICRGGLIFTVLTHSLYLITKSILKGLDKDTHIHGDVNIESIITLFTPLYRHARPQA